MSGENTSMFIGLLVRVQELNLNVVLMFFETFAYDCYFYVLLFAQLG